MKDYTRINITRLFQLSIFIFCVWVVSACANSSGKECDLTPIHKSFCGINWGDSFLNISDKINLVHTNYGGNDREPGYQVASGIPLNIDGIPVDIYMQFSNNILIAIHIHGDTGVKERLIGKFINLYGQPTAFPSKSLAVWQDNISTIALQKNTLDGGCLFTIVNNENYMKQTGRKMNYYKQ